MRDFSHTFNKPRDYGRKAINYDLLVMEVEDLMFAAEQPKAVTRCKRCGKELPSKRDYQGYCDSICYHAKFKEVS